MNKKIVLSILITTLFIGTMFAPCVLSDRRVKNTDITIDSFSTTPTKSQYQQPYQPLNHAPNIPDTPYPADGATDVTLLYNTCYEAYENLEFGWCGGDTNNNPVCYYLSLGTSNPPARIPGIFYSASDNGPFRQIYWASHQAHYDTTYYWRITAASCPRYFSKINIIAESPIWTFTTEAMFPPINPNPSDESTNIPVGDTLLLQCDIAHPHPQDAHVLTKISKNFDMAAPLYDTSSGPFPVTSTYTTSTGNHHFTTEYDTTYYWQAGLRDSDNEVIYSDIWSFTTESVPNPHITEAWSCASHTGVEDDIKLPVNFDKKIGVIEPRDQSHNLNSDENDMYIEIVFDAAVSHRDLHIAIYPSTPHTVQTTSPNTINIQFKSKIPNGIYHIRVVDIVSRSTSTEGFTIAYLNGDVSDDGFVDIKDHQKVTYVYNWQRYLDDYSYRPFADTRSDINRDGVITVLDIARIYNSANWRQSLFPN